VREKRQARQTNLVPEIGRLGEIDKESDLHDAGHHLDLGEELFRKHVREGSKRISVGDGGIFYRS
jgi:hypothetical protein